MKQTGRPPRSATSGLGRAAISGQRRAAISGRSRTAVDDGKRVAFFGGSFDPPHLGHVAVARAARRALELDTVLFAPVGTQPLKIQGGGIQGGGRSATASYEDRLAMTRLAIAGEPGFAISEADKPTASGIPNYTLETLKELRREMPGSTLFFLMGADSFLGLRQWHRAAEIPFAAALVVASRPGQKLEDVKTALPSGLTMEAVQDGVSVRGGVEVRAFAVRNEAGASAELFVLPGLDVRVSASEIRKRLQAARGEAAMREWLPEAVAGYVRAHGLYGSGLL
jgi:nicotinate-nucleotide adenylyltransferase